MIKVIINHPYWPGLYSLNTFTLTRHPGQEELSKHYVSIFCMKNQSANPFFIDMHVHYKYNIG